MFQKRPRVGPAPPRGGEPVVAVEQVELVVEGVTVDDRQQSVTAGFQQLDVFLGDDQPVRGAFEVPLGTCRPTDRRELGRLEVLGEDQVGVERRNEPLDVGGHVRMRQAIEL